MTDPNTPQSPQGEGQQPVPPEQPPAHQAPVPPEQPPAAPQQPPAAPQAPAYQQPPAAPQAPAYQQPPVAPGYQQGYQQVPARKSPVLSIISLIAGIVGVIGFWVVFIPFIGSIMELFIPGAAIVLGFIGRKKEPQAKGMYVTGIILGFVGILIAVLAFIFWIVVVSQSHSNLNDLQDQLNQLNNQ